MRTESGASDPVLIGITGARARASRVMGMPELLLGGIVDLHHVPYTTAVAAAGGTPVQLTRDARPADLVRRLDGVVVAGGDDVDPRLYGSRPGLHATHIDPDRDAFELELIELALRQNTPLLGICRGCQLLNVVRGGTLVDHLPLDAGEAHGQLAYPLHARVHGLDLVRGELLEHVLPADVGVNSFHHQSVAELGRGVVPIATAPDGVCEAIRIGSRALGVQWHPEYLREQPDPVFTWLVDAARRSARAETMTINEEPAHVATS
ncbi:gamma-glutamyl-gamma-aminobutyrate hydrolase family protein [Baekduia soli]|uniref:Gamma-glutamyl-gamma-aminobutyrate hydrolase family protein n=1 Tax=Baekduia soli TaxID=496014 RepID=A0A5B8U042_9ACTN|nr:gamma-glutamyl-gamma-aminobutyrate hydrolase family protein [Baekduia soli]QEC46357.1 gamma-glutamyl-gamma-aminobutyrate hydrolase family protein [Baekduia soli]